MPYIPYGNTYSKNIGADGQFNFSGSRISRSQRLKNKIVIYTTYATEKERPDNFEIVQDHPLAKGLVFAGLGGYAGSNHYHDASQHGNHGTLTNMDPASDWVSELGRRGLGFDGVNDRVVTQRNLYEMGIRRHATCTMWFNVDNVDTYNSFMGDYSLYLGFSVRSNIDATMTAFVYPNNHRITTVDTVLTNTWYCMSFVLNDANIYLFLDGVQVGTASFGDDIGNSDNTFVVAGRGDASSTMFMGGKTVDPIIHNRAISIAEIQQLADPSNVMLSGLIRPIYKRRFFPGVNLDPVELKAITVHTDSKTLMQRPSDFTLDQDHPLAQGLVFAGLGAHAGSNRFHDSSSKGNHGVLTSMAPASDWVIALGRRGLDFDGANDSVVLSRDGGFGSRYTLSAWAKLTTDQLATIFSCDDGTSGAESVLIHMAAGDLRWQTDDASSTAVNVVATRNLGQWYHYCVTSSGTAVGATEIYIDGVPSGDGGDIAIIKTDVVVVGAQRVGGYRVWAGPIADTLIHDRTLTLAEIRQLADPSNILLSGLIQPIGPKVIPIRNSHNRYWVGRDKDFNKSHNWAYSPGIEGGAGVPTTNEDIIIE